MGQEVQLEGAPFRQVLLSTLEAQIDALTCKGWNCPAATRHRKEEGGEKRAESTKPGSNPSWVGHLVRRETQGEERCPVAARCTGTSYKF